MSAMSIFLGIWNYNNFDNYMVSRLFKVHRPDKNNQHLSHLEQMRPTKFLNIYEWVLDFTPSIFRCKGCRKIQRMQEFARAREKLALEVNIIEIVRSRRLIYRAMKLLLTPKQHTELLQESQFTTVIDQ